MSKFQPIFSHLWTDDQGYLFSWFLNSDLAASRPTLAIDEEAASFTWDLSITELCSRMDPKAWLTVPKGFELGTFQFYMNKHIPLSSNED